MTRTIGHDQMTAEQLEAISDWFASFVAIFWAETLEEQRNYSLKIAHTWRVREIIERLAEELALPPPERHLAAALALCHDVGRFPQYRDYGTFNDAVSTDHAALSVQTMKAEGVLENLTAEDRGVLLQGVALHNAFTLPAGLDPAVERYARLLRDADKLDIWSVLIDYCDSAPETRATAVAWGLPETGACSAEALSEILAGRTIERSFIKCVDDFKLLQLSWVYDLNFPVSREILAERGYIEALIALLPDQPECREVAAQIRAQLRAQKG